MQIVESQLRQLISSLLIEGPEQDRQSLIKKYPDSENSLRSLPVKFISWLQDRFGDNARQKEIHPFEDAIVTVVNFAKVDVAIGAKWKSNEQFKKAVEEAIPKRHWSTPTDVKTMTADEMETIIGISQRKKQRFDVQKEDMSFEDDRVGKVGPWNLWMPTNKENSCKIAGYDPATLQPKTTWCTARTSGSNLFYNYVGGSDEDVTLFYIIKDDPKDDNDWLSVGFVKGQPVLEGKNGGLSVNRKNEGLTKSSLESALGSNFSEIMNLLTQKNKQLGGKHPAAKKIEEAGQSVEAFENLVKGLSKDERSHLTAKVLNQNSISQELLIKLAGENSLKGLRVSAIRNPSMPAEVLKKLADQEDFFVKEAVAANPSAPAEVLKKLAHHDDYEIRRPVAENPSAPVEVLRALSLDDEDEVRASVAANISTPVEVLRALSLDDDDDVRASVAENPSTPVEVLSKLVKDRGEGVKDAVAKNLSTPVEVLRVLANDDINMKVRQLAKRTLGNRNLQESLLRRTIRQLL